MKRRSFLKTALALVGVGAGLSVPRPRPEPAPGLTDEMIEDAVKAFPPNRSPLKLYVNRGSYHEPVWEFVCHVDPLTFSEVKPS